MKKRIYCLLPGVIFILASLLACWSPALGADRMKLTDVIVNNTSDDLLAYFNVRDCFDKETNRALMNGFKIRLAFNVRLYQVFHLWPDTLLASRDLEHTIHYDALKEEFVVDLGGQKLKFKDRLKAQQSVCEKTGLPVIALKKLVTGNLYQLQIKVASKKEPTSSVFQYVVYLFSFWATETDSCTVEFKY